MQRVLKFERQGQTFSTGLLIILRHCLKGLCHDIWSCVKVAPLAILQRFDYHICTNNFPVANLLSPSTRYKVNNKNLQH